MKKLLGLLAGAAMTLAVAFGGTTNTVSADTTKPVILVHGYTFGGFLPSAVAMNPLEDYLEAQGYTVYNLKLPGDNNIINAQYIANFAADKGPVHVVGHSMGGISLRYAIKNLGLNAATYVSIDSPQHGEQSSCLWWWDVPSQQMCTSSSFLAALNGGDETPGSTYYVALGGEKYRTTAHLAGACNLNVSGSHGLLPTQAHVQATVLASLQGGCQVVTPPTTTACVFWWSC